MSKLKRLLGALSLFLLIGLCNAQPIPTLDDYDYQVVNGTVQFVDVFQTVQTFGNTTLISSDVVSYNFDNDYDNSVDYGIVETFIYDFSAQKQGRVDYMQNALLYDYSGGSAYNVSQNQQYRQPNFDNHWQWNMTGFLDQRE